MASPFEPLSMASPSTPVLLRMLEPWLERARGRVKIKFDVFAQAASLASDLWIQWQLPSDGALAVEDVEAMELLELLVRVDYEAGWKTLLKMTDNEMYLDQVVATMTLEEGPVFPRYKILGLENVFEHNTFKLAGQRLFFAIEPTEYSSTFFAVRQMLLQCWADRHDQGRAAPFCRRPDGRIPIRLHLDVSKLPREAARRLMEQMSILASLTQFPERLELFSTWRKAWGRITTTLSDIFTLASIDFTLGDYATDPMLASFQDITVNSSVCANHIDLKSIAQDVSSTTTTQFFRTALLTPSARKAARSLDLNGNIPFVQFQAICSAISECQDLRQVCFDLPDNGKIGLNTDDHGLFWAWIAYSVFRAETTHNLAHVDLPMRLLSQDDAQAFSDVLAAKDPAVFLRSKSPYLVPPSDVVSRPPFAVEIRPNATIFIGRKQQQLRTDGADQVLRGRDDVPGSQFVSVVYPGAGLSWVHRSDITRRISIHGPSASTREITSLCLRIGPQTTLPVVTRILDLIGWGVTALTIIGDDVNLLDEVFFAQLFRSCPRLCRLELVEVGVDEFTWLETCGSSLRSLSLIDVELYDVDEQAYRRMLTTVGSSATTQLVELHIQQSASDHKKLIQNFVRMLESNRCIERLLLSVASDSPHTNMDNVKQQLAKLHGEVLGGRSGPLALKCKLSFLSVLFRDASSDAATPDDRGATIPLDAVLVSTIFQFAAPSKRRVCGFVPTLEVH